MKRNFSKKQIISIALLVAVGALLPALILTTGNSQPGQTNGTQLEQANPNEPVKGPKGGKYFAQDGYGVEVTIFEDGVEPEFRIYTYKDNALLPPEATKASIELERLGRKPQTINFAPANNFLRGDAVVFQPHSFRVAVNAQHEGKQYRFAYDQIEFRIDMSAEQMKQSGIELATAGPAKIKSSIELIGEIQFNSDNTVRVVPRLSGIVESAPVNAGDQVKKGQVLAVISSQTLADQRTELLAAQKRLALANTTFEREKKLWEDKISAEQDYLQARNTKQEAEIAVLNARQKLASINGGATIGSQLTRYEIRSPISGTVVEKNIALGQALKEDANIFTVADLSTVWAEMTIYPKDLNTVKVGQQATVKATAFESESVGKVAYVGSLVGEQTRTATARIVLPNPDSVWRPGLPVKVELVAEESEVPVAISTEALQTILDGPAVFGRYGQQFEARPVELGRNDGKTVEVLGGLDAGEQYAATNSFLIKADIGKSGASHDH